MTDHPMSDTGDGGAAAIVAGLVAVALIAVTLFSYFAMTSIDRTPTIELGSSSAISSSSTAL